MTSTPDLEAARRAAEAFQRTWIESVPDELEKALMALTSEGYRWRGSCPLYEKHTLHQTCIEALVPLRRALNPLKRREYFSISGMNDADGGQSVWTCSLGQLSGPFVDEWLGFAPTRQMVQLRYAEFQRIESGVVAETALMFDLADFLHQIGVDLFPDQLGARHVFPPPWKVGRRDCGPKVAQETSELVNRMIEDLDLLNKTGNDTCPPEYLARSWHDDMAWYGPAGIGAMMTIPLYQAQHQYPFRQGLTNKQYHGHVARIADGDYAAFFGWPNLSNSPREGYLGLPASDIRGEMRIVDVYRRDGDKLAENWVIIDLPHYFSFFGIDLIAGAKAALSNG
ncbi:MAG: nuclear transport factor 2 family protein [Erythrobacter sp.]|nr:nuclear transport factor 2 family protein [Erythrobacter sp.]